MYTNLNLYHLKAFKPSFCGYFEAFVLAKNEQEARQLASEFQFKDDIKEDVFISNTTSTCTLIDTTNAKCLIVGV